METQLPGTIGLIVTAVLRRFRDWQGVDRDEAEPSVVRLLGDQSNNVSVLVANSRSYVVRVNRADAAANALDPAAEQAAQLRAAEAGLAPALRYFDPHAGVMVCDYLPADSSRKPEIPAIATLLKSIHTLEPIPHLLDLSGRIRFYRDRLEAGPSNSGRAQRAEAFEHAAIIASKLQSVDAQAALCHNDLISQNRLWSDGRLWAIDWEYAAMGSRWFDLAVVIHGDKLTTTRADELVTAYLERKPSRGERQLLDWAGTCFRQLDHAWRLVNAMPPPIDLGSANGGP